MKYLKLLLVLVLFIGLIYFILNLVSEGETKPGTVKKLSLTAEKIQNENRLCWGKAMKWDLDLYKECRQKIQGNEGANHISHGNASLLKTDLDLVVIKRIQSLLIQEYSKSHCNSDVVRQLMSGYDILCKSSSINSENSIVKEMQRCYDVYSRISNFVSQSFLLNVELKDTPDCHCWNSYLEYKDKQLSLAENYRKDQDYKKYLSQISLFKERLNNDYLDKKLKEGVRSFSSNLSKLLCERYTDVTEKTVTKDDIERIGNDYAAFCSQYGKQASYYQNNDADESLYKIYSNLDNWLNSSMSVVK